MTDRARVEGSEFLEEPADHLEPMEPVAVLLVGGENALGPSLVDLFRSLHAGQYRQILFLSVGVLDYTVLDFGVNALAGFKGSEEAERLRLKTRRSLDPFLGAAHQMGLKADVKVSVSTNAADEIDRLSDDVSRVHPRACYFMGQLIFARKRWYHRFLHGGSGQAIRKRLEKKGLPVKMLPVVLST
jgi:hypothetical protein